MRVRLTLEQLGLLLDLHESVEVLAVESHGDDAILTITDEDQTLGVPGEYKDSEFRLHYKVDEALGIICLDEIEYLG